nr:molybdopterin-dependent oxidoreductase [Tianweitania sp.]
MIDSPHRQLYPLRRTTPKDSDDPKWQRISWEEALAEVAERLETFKAQSGPESVAFGVTTPSGTPLSDSIDWIERFIRHYGSPNTCYATEICNWHKDFAHAFTFGCGIQPADYGNADVILLWGHNPTNTWLAQADAIARGRQRGAKLIVVDPRPTALAKEADVWLRVHPGTDAALALGLIRQMIETEAWDQAFTRSWTNGPLLVRIDNGEFLRSADLWPDEVEAGSYLVWNEETNQAERFDPDARDNIHRSTNWAMRGVFNLSSAGEAQGTEGTICCTPAFALLEQGAEAYTVNYVCRVTGVDPLALAEAGRLLRAGQRIAYHSWTGVGQHTNATQTERSIAALYALTGSFDRVGANRVRRGPLVRQVNALELLPAIREKALGYRERPIGPPAHGWVTARDLYRAILEGLPYKVRALVAFGTNPLISHGDPETGDAALRALEFHVHCDLFLTPSARHADIFLPVNTPWEREGLRVGFEISDEAAALVQLRQRFVSPRGEARSDNDIVFDLACRLGMREAFFDGSLEAGWDYILNPAGLSVEQLRGEPGGVACAIDSREQKYALEHHDGSARLRGFDTETRRIELYSATLHRHGQPAVPAYVPIAPAGSDQPQRYPLTLSTAKNGFYCHSQHRSLVSLRKKAPDPVAEMGPGLAAIKGIRAGDWILVSTSTGDARFRAQITPQLNDNVVVAEFGWWQACEELDRPEMPSTGPLNSNFNRLVTTADHDPVSGSVLHRALACDVKLDPQTEEHQRGWPGLREFRVSRLHAEAEGVTEVHLEPIDAAGLPDYRPGQHIQVSVPGPDDGTLTRAYSLTGPASVHGRHQLQIAVRHQKGIGSDGAAFEGRMSSKVNTHWRVGDTVYVTAPNGSFVLPRNHRQPIILLAGGIGITPVISLLESLPDGCANTITLLYANLNSRTHAFRTAIRRHQARLPGLTVRNHYDSPLEVDRLGVDYDSCERITSDVIADALLRDRPRVYMCGPPAMMDAFADGLIRRGMPKFDIFREVFRSPPELPIDDGRTFSVRFPNSSADAVWSPGEGTLLSFAESLGLALPSGCRVGQCESCAVRIASGHVRHLHGHEPEDPETCLTCQAVPTEDLILVN